MQRKIWQVVDVRVSVLESFPPKLLIVASGTVTSTGWSNSQLIPYLYFVPPADGIYDFDFVAEAPTDIVNPVIIPIVIPFVWNDFTEEVKGIRIHGSSGEPLIRMVDESFSERAELLITRIGNA